MPTEREFRDWFSTEQNLAIVTGALSGVVVVDADSPESVRYVTRRLTYTGWQTQTSRGFHLFYSHPGYRVTNRARIETEYGPLAIDVRADGGYVIAPGSLHASGFVYCEAGDWTDACERLPVFWLGWLHRPRRPRPAGRRCHGCAATSLTARVAICGDSAPGDRTRERSATL